MGPPRRHGGPGRAGRRGAPAGGFSGLGGEEEQSSGFGFGSEADDVGERADDQQGAVVADAAVPVPVGGCLAVERTRRFRRVGAGPAGRCRGPPIGRGAGRRCRGRPSRPRRAPDGPSGSDSRRRQTLLRVGI
ncbi:hypothetical protein KCH_76250 [Kitasatospora cheerisanensis KCTC 2395]|uniref:Uncharacterized protein n=1 Tax=Kitasatospora cheerisanensis KCTC 2395 TaxID=1348663 RepID=A0A066YR65_9ACTN|nr:hypothetical protein KCH_76250 [Kitasatospora cheerisanensis KCTC 2395]